MTRVTDNIIICGVIVGSDAAGQGKAYLSCSISTFWLRNLDSVGLQQVFKAALCRNV